MNNKEENNRENSYEFYARLRRGGKLLKYIIPVNGKIAKLKDWPNSEIVSNIFSDEESEKLIKKYKATGIAVLTGSKNRLIAFDIDGAGAHTFWDRSKFSLLELHTPTFTSGKQHRKQILFEVTEEQDKVLANLTRKVIHFEDGSALEIRYNKCYSVIPPSKHPETQGYIWECVGWILDLTPELFNFVLEHIRDNGNVRQKNLSEKEKEKSKESEEEKEEEEEDEPSASKDSKNLFVCRTEEIIRQRGEEGVEKSYLAPESGDFLWKALKELGLEKIPFEDIFKYVSPKIYADIYRGELEGNRNNVLARIAYELAGLGNVFNCEIYDFDYWFSWIDFYSDNCSPALTFRELNSTLKSAFRGNRTTWFDFVSEKKYFNLVRKKYSFAICRPRINFYKLIVENEIKEIEIKGKKIELNSRTNNTKNEEKEELYLSFIEEEVEMDYKVMIVTLDELLSIGLAQEGVASVCINRRNYEQALHDIKRKGVKEILVLAPENEEIEEYRTYWVEIIGGDFYLVRIGRDSEELRQRILSKGSERILEGIEWLVQNKNRFKYQPEKKEKQFLEKQIEDKRREEKSKNIEDKTAKELKFSRKEIDKDFSSLRELKNYYEILNSEEKGDLDWIIEGLLPKGEVVLLCAMPKIGKSMLATELVYRILSRDRVMGTDRFSEEVLYIASDEGLRALEVRMKNRGFPKLPDSAKRRLWLLNNFSLNDLLALDIFIQKKKIGLVVIDSLSSVSRDVKVSENEAAFAKYLYKLSEIAQSNKCTILVIHHENKIPGKKNNILERVAGTTRIAAAVWGIMFLEKTEDIRDVNRRILTLIPREGQAIQLNLELRKKNRWSTEGIFAFDPIFLTKLSLKRRILEYLRNCREKEIIVTYDYLQSKLGIREYFDDVMEELEIDGRISIDLDEETDNRVVSLSEEYYEKVIKEEEREFQNEDEVDEEDSKKRILEEKKKTEEDESDKFDKKDENYDGYDL